MISIIIPALNEEKYLPKLLDCLKNQAFGDFEIIVADADSKDGTKKIAKKYGCKIVKGGLPAAGRNNGAKAAKGDVLLFLDADVQIDKYFLKNAVNEMKNQNLDIAGCTLNPVGNNLIDKLFFMIFNLWTSATQFIYPNAAGCSIFCKKWLHDKVNGFDETIKLSEDMDYAKRCGKCGKFGILKKVAVNVAMRRFESEGRVKVAFKLFMSAIYRIFLGEIRSDVFKYNLRYRK